MSSSSAALAGGDGIILPPASSLNPIPCLPVALRLDNQEQLVDFLLKPPEQPASSSTTTSTSTISNMKQIFVFGTNSLRTLIMRQVLSNPENSATKTASKKKKNNNWDPLLSYPDIPKGIHLIGTRLLKQQQQRSEPNSDSDSERDISMHSSMPTTNMEEIWKTDSYYNHGNANDSIVITYFLRPNDLEQTQLAMHHMNLWKQQQQSSAPVVAGGSASSSRRGKSSSSSMGTTRQHHHRFLYFPQITSVIQKIHTDIGLTAATSDGSVSVHSLQLDLFPLETDVLSLELEDTYREDAIDETPSYSVTNMARSILKIQDIVGPIPRIQSYGPLSEDVLKKVLDLSVDEYIRSTTNTNATINDVSSTTTTTCNNNPVDCGEVAALILMDRKVDMVSPFVTALTYEGLVDEMIGIDCGYITVNVNTINPPDDSADDTTSSTNSPIRKPVNTTDKNTLVELGVNGSDTLYNEVRNQHVEKFGSFLQNQAKALQQSHANFTDKNKKKELSEIHQFVKQMPIFTQNLRSLTNHIHIAELIKKYSENFIFRERWQLERNILEGDVCYDQLDDLIAMQYDVYPFLALLCLQSICSGGIKSSRYDSIRRDIVQTYGYEYIFILTNLEKAGLLRRRDGLWIDTASPFNTLRKSLILINAEVDTVEPDDISYVSSGYAPISVRIIQTAMKGWTGRDDILREIPGRHIDILQQYPPEDITTAKKRRLTSKSNLGSYASTILDTTTAATNNNNNNNAITPTTKKPVLIVFYVGGVTYMEIAALRFLSKRPTFPYHIICMTTKIINGVTILQSLRS